MNQMAPQTVNPAVVASMIGSSIRVPMDSLIRLRER
jgi:hypothetical protein